MPIGTQFFVVAAIFASMSLLLGERDSGTLAWTISKPVSRTSVLVSKWLTSTLLLWLATVVVPSQSRQGSSSSCTECPTSRAWRS